jgi:tRNA (mo5U34)-methyltransferase
MSRQWMHSLDLPTGPVTGRRPLSDLRAVADLVLPPDMTGLEVLDIGPADGFFSFESERRGAARVVALDSAEPGHFGLLEAKEAFQSKVECVFGKNVYDLTPRLYGTFDLVLFMGVYYHLRYPLLALDRISVVCRDQMAFETFFLPDESNDRAMYQFFRLDEGAPGDYSVWFAPNARAIEDSLISAGFEPRHLATYGDRTLYKASRTKGEPEFCQLRTHEARYIAGK